MVKFSAEVTNGGSEYPWCFQYKIFKMKSINNWKLIKGNEFK